MPKLVNIRLFKDNRNYAGDVFVSVNGESYLIQRGVTVAVPEYIAEVLESSQREDENAALRMERAERSYMDRLSKVQARQMLPLRHVQRHRTRLGAPREAGFLQAQPRGDDLRRVVPQPAAPDGVDEPVLAGEI